MDEDPKLRSLIADPRGRRVLVTDGFNPVGAAATQALLAAGAAIVFQGAGRLQDWSVSGDAGARLKTVPLDVTDTVSVERLAAEIGHKVDILINTATMIRPGGLFDRNGCVTAQDEMATNYFGALRLAQAFGPVMRSRAADAPNSAAAWVNILSINALVNGPPFVCFNASQAAALSLSQGLRAAFQGSGVRVLNILIGPLDDEWRQSLAPPKVSPAALAGAIIAGLKDGVEEVAVGDVARELHAEWKLDAKATEIALRG
jgi:NAD(P)-dependent dehydrogenase (short-subunit alcohol dehydrogenase family)